MFICMKRFSIMVPAILLFLGNSLPSGGAQQPKADPAQNAAKFQAVPMAAPSVSTSVYSPYVTPYDSYWNGMADIVTNMLQPLPGSMQQQKYFQAKIETRRMHVDEFLYERAVMPTTEDDRERARVESVRRARNDPPLTEIWAGIALNRLLDAIQKMHARGVTGPNVPLDPDVVRHINVTSGAGGGGSIGVLRDDGKISWPLSLRLAVFQGNREKVDQFAYEAYRQATSGPVDADALFGMKKAVDALGDQIRENVDEISANDYIAARRFLNQLTATAKAFEDPKISNYVSRKWAARGSNVAELTRNMTREGLLFAAATPGDQEAYLAVHRAMVDYFSPPSKPWDPLAK